MARNRTPIDKQLLDQLLNELDTGYASKFGRAGPPDKLSLLIVGGAALITRFGHRSTFDVDALTTRLPPKLTSVINDIAIRHGMENDWLNNTVGRNDSHVRTYDAFLYRSGVAIDYYFPSETILLVMKVAASRPHDIVDAIKLAVSTGIDRYHLIINLCHRKLSAPDLDDFKRRFVRRAVETIHLMREDGKTDAEILAMPADTIERTYSTSLN